MAPKAKHEMTTGKLKQAQTLRAAGHRIPEIARLLELPREVVRNTFRGKHRPIDDKPQRCPKCGHMVQMPCFECDLEAKKQANREARLVSSQEG